MLLRRETGTEGPIAITSASASLSNACRPASRSAVRLDGASTVTVCPSTRSSFATPVTWSLTSCGTDHANGVTRQTLIEQRLVVVRRPPSGRRHHLRLDRRLCLRARVLRDEA